MRISIAWKKKQLEKKQDVFNVYKNGLKGLESIENQYIKSDLDNKRRLIGSIFPENFQFENKKVRTADINPILDKIARFSSVNRKNKKGINLKKKIYPVLYTKLSYFRNNR